MPSESPSIEQLLALLAGTPPRLATLTAGVAPAQLRAASGDDEWSATDVLAHLRACADVWGGCIAAILAEERPTLRAVNPRAWIKKTDYRDLEFRPSLQAFATQRAELLAVLVSLPPDSWSRTATVTGVGKPRERTVLFYARWLAAHEQPHLKQISRLVAAMPGESRPPRPE